MEDEERELIQQKNDELKPSESKTGANSHVNSDPANNLKSMRQRCFSNGERDYSDLMNQFHASKFSQNLVKSDNDEEKEKSFDLEINNSFANFGAKNSITLNKENFLTYDKKVECKIQPFTSNIEVEEKFRAERTMRKDDKSFNNMSNYVKNTFRKEKANERKHSQCTYSSQRKHDNRSLGTPHSVKNSNDSSRKEEKKAYIVCKNKDCCANNLISENKELKEELHKVRKQNGVLRLQISKFEKESNSLRNNKVELIEKIEQIEKARERDYAYIKKQDSEIQKLHDRLKRSENETNSEKIDSEKEQLKANFDKIVEVKLKYEHIIKALAEKPEIKPIIANILEQMY